MRLDQAKRWKARELRPAAVNPILRQLRNEHSGTVEEAEDLSR